MSARLLLSKPSTIFPLSISLKSKVFSSQFRVFRAFQYHPRVWKSAQSWSKSPCAQGGLGHFLIIVTNGVNMSARILLSRRSKIFPLSFSLKIKVFSNQCRVFRAFQYRPSCWKSVQSWSKWLCAQGGLGHFLVIVTKGVNMQARLLLRKRLKFFPLFALLNTKAFSNSFRVPRGDKYRLSSWKLAQSWSKSRCALAGLGHFLFKSLRELICRPDWA